MKRRSSQPFTWVWLPWQRAHAAAFAIGWTTAYSRSFPLGDCTTVVLSNFCRSGQGTAPTSGGAVETET